MSSDSFSLPLPGGFQAAGLAAGIKTGGGPDLALLYSTTPALLAGALTTNRCAAAPVQLCRQCVAQGQAQAVLINSGCANAGTGAAGLADAQASAAALAERLACAPELVCVCSTGHIGDRLPLDKLLAGAAQAIPLLSPAGGAAAARAIMTTDTRPKTATRTLTVDGRCVRISGLAKGSGMIEPHMATMLAFVLTDAAVAPAALRGLWADAVAHSFNRITVDGDQSTNDTALCLANGQAGNRPLDSDHPDWHAFADAMAAVALDLALAIVDDGEGATKRVTVAVQGAASAADAERAARAIANSLLVKTSWVRGDCNWGRVFDAIGYCGAAVDPLRVNIFYDDLPACRQGVAAKTPSAELEAIVAQPRFTLTVDLQLGPYRAVVYTCDCTEEYVRINW